MPLSEAKDKGLVLESHRVQIGPMQYFRYVSMSVCLCACPPIVHRVWHLCLSQRAQCCACERGPFFV